MQDIEFNEAREPDGKRHFKVSLHEIYPDRTHTNENGICYLREYTERNMGVINESTIPLCCAFADDAKRVPIDHGVTGIRARDGMPLFEDSVVVGVINRAEIETVELQGEQKTVLMGYGVIYEQRYPQLAEWIDSHLAANVPIHGSVEFVGKAENNGEIKYEDNWSDELRVPTDYLYSGYCLLTVPAGDNAAFLLELNNRLSKEGNQMNEEIRKEITETIVNSFGQLHGAEETLRSENESLKSDINARNSQIEELNAKITELEEKLAAKDEEINTLKTESANAAASVNQMQEELNQVKVNDALAKFDATMSAYTDEQKAVASAEIEAYKANPLGNEAVINQITDKIEAAAYRSMKVKQAEINQKKVDLSSLIGAVPTVNKETTIDIEKLFG